MVVTNQVFGELALENQVQDDESNTVRTADVIANTDWQVSYLVELQI